jgi:hypothetical protein
MADIRKLAKGKTKRRRLPKEVMTTIRAAREAELPWREVAVLLKKHHSDWALNFATLIARNKNEKWGL